MLSKIEKYLLDIGTEDYCRLWEAVVAYKDAHPELSDAAAINSAQATILTLLEAGLVNLYFDNLEDSSERVRRARKLEPNEIGAAFASREAWVPNRPRPDRGYAYATTEAGERAIYG